MALNTRSIDRFTSVEIPQSIYVGRGRVQTFRSKIRLGERGLEEGLDEKWIRSTYEAKNGPHFNPQIRDSFHSTRLYGIDFTATTFKEYRIPTEYEFIKYERGGLFRAHVDKSLGPNHVATLLLYPPQKVEGGSLEILNESYRLEIHPSETEWTCVLLCLGVMHTSHPVFQGIKYVYKAPVFVKDYTLFERLKSLLFKTD